MSILIACLSTGKGTWAQVNQVIDSEKWSKVYLVTNDFGKENFNKKDSVEYFLIDQNAGLVEIRDSVFNFFKDKVKDTEIGLNFISGTGKEHMAVLSAVLKLGVGIRFVAGTKEGNIVL